MGQTILLILALVALTQAGPITNSETCSKRCTGTQKFGYERGTTYEYDYTSDIDTTMQGSAEDKAGISMLAKVDISVVSKCEMIMTLRDVQLQESDPHSPGRKINADTNGEFKARLEANPLPFSFQDGIVEELCTSTPEHKWVLNIKRGILSSLQNSMDHLNRDQQVKETDVAGECNAEYTMVNDGWLSKTIKKTKNLLGCVKRNGYNTLMQGTPYRVASEIQSLPLVKGTHECTQEISKAGILKSSTCTEEHVLRPFSRDSSGAVTKTIQNLVYSTERSGPISPVSIVDRLPLTFEHANGNKGSMSEVISKLVEICKETENSVKADTPNLFVDLVRLMKALDSSELERLFSQVKGSRFCPSNQKRAEKFFLDAIPMLGTEASLKMMTGLILRKEVTGVEANMWLTTLAFVKDPTKEMLNQVRPLLSSEDNDKAMLGVSSLIHAYCKKVSCENDRDIESLVSAIENKIGVGCYVDKSNLDKIILSLKALGNAGHVQRALTTITNCISKMENPTEVRLAAIQAFRRMPCSVDRSDIMSLFRNQQEDSELRIAAYLGLMTCPSDDVLSKVRYLLESEEVNQVGSFVWSHLTNLMETASPLKQEIKRILNDNHLQKQFDLEKLKYSRNYEKSFFLEKLNTGASIDSNVIWSSKSFLPRSAMTNVTFDLFGHSVNLIEIGGRMEGLEYFLESYFGPNGYFQTDDVSDVEKQSIKGISDRKMEAIDRQYGSEMNVLKGDMYMRVFGNELLSARFAGLSDFTDGKTINVLDILTALAKKQEYSFTQNIMFLDSSMIIPTIAGLPLNLTIDGTATIDLKASGKVDLRKIASRSPSISIDGYMKPSGSVLINSIMSIDAFVTTSGMKMESTMHSSSSLDGKIELENGKVLQAELKTPFDQMEVFNVKTAFFTLHRNAKREQKMITDNRQTKKVCSGDELAKITGMELCAELQYPNASLKADAPYFPLTGPVSAGITLLKRDTHNSYKFEYQIVKSRTEARARVAFNTPESRVDRELSIDMMARNQNDDPIVELSLKSPWKKASLRGAIVGDSKQKQLTGRVVIDEKKVYSFTAEWIRDRKGQLWVYTPYVEVIVPNMENIKLSSKVEYVIGKSLDGELTVQGLSKHPIQTLVNLVSKKAMTSVKTSISFEPGKIYSFETRLQKTETKKALKMMPHLSIKTPVEELVTLGGSVEYKSGSLILVDLVLDELFDKQVKIYTKLTRSVRKSGNRYQSKVDIQTPYLRLKGNSNIQVQNTAIVTRINMDYVIPKVARDKIVANSKFTWRLAKSKWSATGKGKINFKKNSDYDVDFSTDLSNTKTLTKADIDLKYGAKSKDENKRIYVSSLVRHELDWKKSDLDINADIRHLDMGVDLKVKGSHKHSPRNLATTLNIGNGKGQPISIALNLKDKTRKFISINGDAKLKWNNREIVLSNIVEQKNKRKITNEFNAKLDDRTAKIISNLKLSDDEYEVSTDVNVKGYAPTHVEGLINVNPRNFRIRSQYNNDYSIELGSQYKRAALLRLTGDLTIPTRRVKGEVVAKRKDTAYIGQLELQWDANKDTNKRVFFDTQIDVKSRDDIYAFVTLKSPIQNHKMSFRRKDETGNFDLTSNGNKIVSADGSFKQIKNAITSAMTVSTSYKPLRFVQVSFDHSPTSDKSKTNLEINWKPDNRVSAVLTLDKPISLRKIHSTLNIKTPFKGYESSSLEISHDMNEGLVSSVNVDIADTRVQASGSFKKSDNAYQGLIDIKSNIPSVKLASLELHHKTIGTATENRLSFTINEKNYKYEGQLTHDRVGVMVTQNGLVLITIPERKYQAKWNHKNTASDMSSAIDVDLNNDKYKLNIDAKHRLDWTDAFAKYEIKAESPFTNGQLSVSHSHQPGSLDTIITASKDKQNLFTLDSHLKTQNGERIATGNLMYRNKQLIATEGRLRTGNTKYARLTISTSLNTFKRLTSEVEFTGDLNAHTASASLELEPVFGKMKLLSSLIRGNEMSGKVRIETPYQQVPYSEIALSRRPENGKDRVDLKIEYLPRKVIALTTRTLLQGKQLDADLSLTMLKERLFASVVHQPTTKGCISRVRVEYPQNKVYFTELTSEYKQDYGFDLVANAPDFHPVKVSIGHKGSWDQFSSGAELQYSKDQRHKIEAKFNNGKRIQGSFTMQSPLTKDVTASFLHSGDWGNVKSNAMMKYGQQKPFSIQLESSISKRTKGTMKLTSPYFKDISVLISHKGKPTNFRTRAKVEYGEKNEIDSDLNFSMVKDLRIDLTMTTPFRNIRKLSAFVTHEGSLKNFNCQTEVRVGKNTWSANVKSKLDPIISSEVIVSTPHEGYENMRALVTHEGDLSNFKCHAEVAKNKQEITGHLEFTKDPVSVTITLKTPFRGYRNLAGRLNHKGRLSSFKTQGDLTYSDSNTVSFETSVNTDSRITASLNVKTPFQSFKGVDLKLTHSGSINNFVSRLEALYDKRRSQVDVEFTTLGPIEGKMTMVSPVIEPLKLAFSYGKSESVASANYGDKVLADGRFSLQLSPTIQSQLVFKSIYTDDIRATLEHIGSRKSFNSKATAAYGTKTVNIEANLDTSPTLTLNIDTPFETIKSGRISLTHKGQLRNFQSGTVIQVNSKTLKANIELDTTNGLKLKTAIETPFEAMRTSKLSFRHQGYLQNFECNGEYFHNGKSADVQLSLRSLMPIDGQVIIRTPFTEDFSLKVNHDGELSKFSTSTEAAYGAKSASAKLSFEKGHNMLMLNGNMKTPFMSDVDFNSQTTLTLSEWRSENHVSLDGKRLHDLSGTIIHGNTGMISKNVQILYNNKMAEGNIKFDMTKDIELTLKIKTPLTKDLDIALLHSGPLRKFSNSLEVAYGEQKHELSSTFSLDGSLRKFKSSALMSYNRQSMSSDVELDLTRDPEGSLTFRSPYSGEVIVSFSHQGTRRNFISTGKISYSGRKQHEARLLFDMTKGNLLVEGVYNSKRTSLEAKLDRSNGLSGQVTLKTPLTDDIVVSGEYSTRLLNFLGKSELVYSGRKQHAIDISFNHIGDLSNFRTTAEATYNSKKVTSEVELDSTNGVKGRIVLKTPISKEIRLEIEQSGSMTNFHGNADISYSGSKQHEMSTSWDIRGSLKNFDVSGNAIYNKREISTAIVFGLTDVVRLNGRLSTPFTDEIVFNLNHDGNSKEFRTEADLTYSGRKQHDVLVTFKRVGTLRKFQVTGEITYNNKITSLFTDIDTSDSLKANLVVKTPVTNDIVIELEGQRSGENFQSKADISYSGSKQHELIASIRSSKSLGKFSITGSASYNGKEISSMFSADTEREIRIQTSLKSPFTEDFGLTLTHNGKPVNFESRLTTDYSGKTQHDLQAKFSLSGTTNKFTSEVRFSLNSQEAVITMDVDTTDGINGQVNIIIPGMEDMSAVVRQNTDISNLEGRLELSYGRQKHEFVFNSKVSGDLKAFTISTTLRYNTHSVSTLANFDIRKGLDVSVQTPISGYERSMTKLEYSRENGIASGKWEIKAGKYKAEINTKLETFNGIRFELCIKTPVTKDLEIIVNGNGKLNDLEGESSLSYGQDKATLNGKLTSSNGLKLEICLKTPYTRDFEIIVNGNKKMIESSVSYGQDKATLNGKLEMINGLKLEICLKTPYTRDLEIIINGNTHAVEASLGYGQDKATFNGKLEMIDGIKIESCLKTPYTRDLEVIVNGNTKSVEGSLGYGQDKATFNGKLEMIDGIKIESCLKTPYTRDLEVIVNGNTKSVEGSLGYGQDKATFNGKLEMIDGIKIESCLKTPYTRDLEVIINGNTRTVEASLGYGQDKATFNGKLEMTDGIKIESCLKTPYTRDLEVIVNGNTKTIDASLGYGQDKATFNGKLEMTDGIKIESCLKTPYTRDLEVIVNGNTRTVEASVGYGKDKATLNGKLEIVDGVKLEICLKTPYTKDFEVILNHDGNVKKFNSELSVSYGNDRVKAVVSHELTSRKANGYIRIETPVLDDIKAEYTMEGESRSFTSSAQLSIGDSNGIKELTVFRLGESHIDLDTMVTTTLTGTERISQLKVNHRGDILNFRSSFEARHGNKEIKARANFKSSPSVEGSFNLETPFRTMRGNIQHNGSLRSFSSTGSLQYSPSQKIEGRVSLDANSLNNIFLDTDIQTPFELVPHIQCRMKHNLNDKSLQTSLYFGVVENKPIVDGNLRIADGKIEGAARLATEISYLRDIRFNIKHEAQDDSMESRLELFVNSPEGIIIATSATRAGRTFIVQTPWKKLREAQGKIKMLKYASRKVFLSDLSINRQTVFDGELNYDEQNIAFNIKEPRKMGFELGNVFLPNKYIVIKYDRLLSGETTCRLDVSYNPDWSSDKQHVIFGGNCGTDKLEIQSKYESREKYTLSFLRNDVQKLGFDIQTTRDTSKMAIVIPTRKLEMQYSEEDLYGEWKTETSFAWDADRDQNKRIVLKTSERKEDKEVKLALEMPSLGENVQLDTKMIVNRGSIIYDGRTEFRYSTDSRKTLTVHSKLENVNQRGEEYKFELGVSHPYTTVDVLTNAKIIRSDDKLAADVDIKYLTAQRQTKIVALMTEIDKIKRQLSLKIKTPVKSMSMDATVGTNPYKLSIKNMYDETKPINAELSVDPENMKVDLNMNYDIENPRNTLHINAEFNDLKGISAELYRDTNGQKVVDSLLNLKLKTSRILHTRVQWRPSVLSDLKNEMTKRMADYRIRSSRSTQDVREGINKELVYKKQLIRAGFDDAIKPYSEIIEMLRDNAERAKRYNHYHVRDICDAVDSAKDKASEMTNELKESWMRCPLKHRIDEYIQGVQQLGKDVEELYDVTLNRLNEVESTYYQKLEEAMRSVQTHDYIQRVTPYMETIRNMDLNDQMSNMADKYTSTIYNIREGINSGLVSNLPTPVYNLGSSAYKYWELEENVIALKNKLIEEIKKDASKEVAIIKEVFSNLLKSKIVTYDPRNGDIEFDLYLPVDVESLASIPDISINKYLPAMPSLPAVKLGSVEDYIPHLSWSAHASIDGNRFTTFDGQTFDFSGRCSYVLAKDYMDGSFSMILNFMGRQKKKLIVTAHKENVQIVPGGKVKVNGKETTLPYKSSDFAVFSEDGKVIVEGKGFQIRSNEKEDKIDIDISKWFFGKTGGLLGTFNHERYDDMTLPNRQITSDAFALGQAWQVEERCR